MSGTISQCTKPVLMVAIISSALVWSAHPRGEQLQARCLVSFSARKSRKVIYMYENWSDKELREQFWYQEGKKEGLIMGRSLQNPYNQNVTDNRIEEMTSSIERVKTELESRRKSR